MSQGTVSLLERGRIASMPIESVRRVLAGLDAELILIATWRGGDLERLIDAQHARLVELTADWLGDRQWVVVPEVSYSIFGERGSIDLVGWHAATATLLIVEVKSEITSVEETLRKHDAKVRLGPRVVQERFPWRPVVVARLLVVPNQRTIRRQIDSRAGIFGRAYPFRNVAVRRWLRRPVGPIDGLVFVSDTNLARTGRVRAVRKRVRVPAASVGRPAERAS